MRSYDEMAQNVFRRGDEYFQKKQKQAAFIKKGVSFMSITGIIIALGLVAGSTQLLSPAIPDEPQQIDLNTDITTTIVTSTAETAEASVTSTSASVTAAASAEVTVTADITTEAFTVTTTAAKTTQTAQTAQTTETTAVTATTAASVTEEAVTTTAASEAITPDVNIYEEYTFDEFIRLSEEEICSISYEVSELYNHWFDQISGYDVTSFHFAMSVPYITTDENGQETADADRVKAALYLPEDMPVDYRCPLNDIEYIQYTIDCGNYFYENNYSTAIIAAALVWIDANPNTGDFIDPEIIVGDGTASLQEKYTYDEFLALGADGICAISDETAQLYEKWSAETDWFKSGIVHSITLITHDKYMKHVESEDGGYDTEDLDALQEVINIPDEMWLSCMGGAEDIIYRKFLIRAYLTDEAYSEYEYSYIVAATLVWLESNPAVESVKMSAHATGGVWEPPVVSVTGDVDGSGKVDLTDASIVLTIYARRSVWIPTDMYTDEMHIRADVDGDGMISLSDGACIIQYFSSNAASIPVTWDEILNA